MSSSHRVREADGFKSVFFLTFFPESLKTKTGIQRTHYCDVRCFVQSTLICICSHSWLTNTWVTPRHNVKLLQSESQSKAYKLCYVPLSFNTEAGEIKTKKHCPHTEDHWSLRRLKCWEYQSYWGGKKDESCEISESWKRNLINEGFCARTQPQRDSFHFLMNPLTHESEIRRASV